MSATFRPPPLRTGPGAVCDLLGVPFSDQQLAAITAPPAPGVIVAGAGSGKTTVMAARVVWLVGRGVVRPEEVLGLTFTRKAAAELSHRVRDALARLAAANGTDLGSEPTVVTYHGYAGGLVAEHGLRLGLEPDLALVSDASTFQRAGRVVSTHAGGLHALSTHLPTVVADVVALDAQMSDHLVEPDDVRAASARLRGEVAAEPPNPRIRAALETAAKRDELVTLVERYRDAKARDGVTDFADQMAAGARLATGCPVVGAEARARYAVVLLDEYQDTSSAQRLMLQRLFSGSTPAGGRGHPITAVGDPCQAIYGWRGAGVDNIDAFPEHFPAADGSPARVDALSVNRRCSAEILAAANSLAGRLYDRHRSVRPLEPDSRTGSGQVSVALLSDVTCEVEHVADAVRDAPAALASTRAPDIAGVHAAAPARWSDVALLVRTGAETAALSAALRRRGVPVEVVGVHGLLGQPEVADVLATLEVVDSLTANAALLRLLTGPRWRIGARDLALLGRRARQLSGAVDDTVPEGLDARLEAAVTSRDTTELPSLSDALDDPGPLAYSAPARSRFAALSAELSALRRAAGEPLLDLTRRVVATIGLDVELDCAPGPDADCGRDNLALLLDVVARFGADDPYASLPGLLAYLRAEEHYNAGMAVAVPTARDSVKLLTAHQAKGLEWRAVFVPFLCRSVFPSTRPRGRWTTTAVELPAELRADADSLPLLAGWAPADDRAHRAECATAAELEELRLAYVAMTRAKDLVALSGHWWGRTQKERRGPSAYLRHVHDRLSALGHATCAWAPDPETDEEALRDETGALVNPLLAARERVPWPAPLDEERLARRRSAAALVEAHRSGDAPAGEPAGGAEETAQLDRLAALDEETALLLAEAAQEHTGTVVVDLPERLSATDLLHVSSDPQGYAHSLVRPMPRRPSTSARFGTRFHAWVEAHAGQQSMLGPEELPGRADTEVRDEGDLARLTAAFESGPYADRRPVAVEAPFQLALGGRVVAGRIDAVYADADGGVEVVDWKTGSARESDPLQLAVYRLAWAEMHELPLDQVRAAFVHVAEGKVVRPPLADRTGLESLLAGGAPAPIA